MALSTETESTREGESEVKPKWEKKTGRKIMERARKQERERAQSALFSPPLLPILFSHLCFNTARAPGNRKLVETL